MGASPSLQSILALLAPPQQMPAYQAPVVPQQSQPLPLLQLLQALQPSETLPQPTAPQAPAPQASQASQALLALLASQTPQPPVYQYPAEPQASQALQTLQTLQTLQALLASQTPQAPQAPQTPPQQPSPRTSEEQQLWQRLLLEQRNKLRFAEHLQENLTQELLKAMAPEQRRELFQQVFDPTRFVESFERMVQQGPPTGATA